jgi:hypothetical protein
MGMVNGIVMTLMMGQGTPSPAPRRVMDALQSVEIAESSRTASGFQLQFALAPGSPLRTMLMLPGGNVPPMMRVIIGVTVNGSLEVLMDGVMTHHELVPAGKGHMLSVTGEDLTRVMDYADSSGKPFPATSPEARVASILSRYQNLGVKPRVVPSGMNDVPSAGERVPLQKGKDLAYLRALAEQMGHVFYIEPGPTMGSSTAYWGPEIRPGQAQPPLNVNFGPRTNVESLTFAFDSESAAKVEGSTQDPDTKESKPVEPGGDSGNQELSKLSPLKKQDAPRHEMSKYTPGLAAQVQKGAAARSELAVTGTGKLDVLRYGRVLRARRLVGARGGGDGFNGLYLVRSVTHHIARGSYAQDFTLVRNGLMPTVSALTA